MKHSCNKKAYRLIPGDVVRLERKAALTILTFWVSLVLCFSATGQQAQEKLVNEVGQLWLANKMHFSVHKRWTLFNEIHLRRTDFAAKPNSYLLRVGAKYSLQSHLSIAGGYVHRWLTKTGSWSRYQNERRAYQEVLVSKAFNSLTAKLRLRTEQRFFNNVVDANSLNDDFMVHRFRLLAGLAIPLNKGGDTKLTLADELHLNYANKAVVNTFNQNRFLIGVKQPLSQSWSFNLGYMMLYQRQSRGSTYTIGHTLRLFFTGNFKAK